MSKKTLLLSNMEGHQYYPEHRTGWSDTWVEFHLRRKKIHLGPCLLSVADLDREREMFGDDPEKYGYEEPVFPDGDWEFCLPYPDEDDRGTPNIAVNSPFVNKDLIERAIGWYVRRTYGLTAEFRYRWKANKSGFFITPV
tara:strand:- start:9794 stop:10213 length:420 start_codon:yes stop_codon:yes gene_type:complete